MNNWLFLSLLLAHIIGDFYLQMINTVHRKRKGSSKAGFCMCIRLLSVWYHGQLFLFMNSDFMPLPLLFLIW